MEKVAGRREDQAWKAAIRQTSRTRVSSDPGLILTLPATGQSSSGYSVAGKGRLICLAECAF